MKSIDEKIALSEAQWHKYRYENAGVRESTGRLRSALKRSLSKRLRCLTHGIGRRLKRADFTPSYDESRENIVVSLTSTEGRIQRIFPTLYSLASQTRKPDLIVLWLGKDRSYKRSVISGIEGMGVTVRYREDLGPNTKYHYAFREYGRDVVITVDDDIIYDSGMVEELYDTYLQHPDPVTARRVHRIRFDRNRQPVSYSDWIWEYRDDVGPAHDLLATGVGGVLYPPSVMAQKCWENTDFLKVCPSCDDIWLKYCELSRGIKVCAVKDGGYDLDIMDQRSGKHSLSSGNVPGGRNDAAVRACTEYFGYTKDLCEKMLEE